jgi:hypothetical protein
MIDLDHGEPSGVLPAQKSITRWHPTPIGDARWIEEHSPIHVHRCGFYFCDLGSSLLDAGLREKGCRVSVCWLWTRRALVRPEPSWRWPSSLCCRARPLSWAADRMARDPAHPLTRYGNEELGPSQRCGKVRYARARSWSLCRRRHWPDADEPQSEVQITPPFFSHEGSGTRVDARSHTPFLVPTSCMRINVKHQYNGDPVGLYSPMLNFTLTPPSRGEDVLRRGSDGLRRLAPTLGNALWECPQRLAGIMRPDSRPQPTRTAAKRRGRTNF